MATENLKPNDVMLIAKLAKLSFSQEEKGNLIQELNKIFHWIEQLDQIQNTQNKSTSKINADILPTETQQRKFTNQLEAIIQNTPHTHKNLFVVPKVVK